MHNPAHIQTHAHTGQAEQGQGKWGSLSLNLCYFSVPARDKDCRIMSNVLCACALHCFTYLLCLFMHSLPAFPPPLPLFPSLHPPLCLHKLLLLTVLNYRSFCICMFDKLFARHSQSVSGQWQQEGRGEGGERPCISVCQLRRVSKSTYECSTIVRAGATRRKGDRDSKARVESAS